MNWKPILYEYVRASNQRETDYGPASGAKHVTDGRFQRAERRMLSRLRQWHEERGARPLGSETKLTIRRVREEERSVTVDIDMRKAIQVRSGGREHSEERVERERVTIENTPGGELLITRIEPIVPELYAISGPATLFGGTDFGARTVPFLNEQVLVRPYPEGWQRDYRYDREAARAYADRHWNEPNPQYLHFDVDCTNYVSQCLYAGGAPMNYTGGRGSGWWYKGKSGGRELWSFSWSVAHSLQILLSGQREEGLRAQSVGSAGELTIGDVIAYDFDGDGRFQHTTIVTGADGAGMPLVNAHTTNSKARYWDYRDSYAWTDRTQYRFFRIADAF